jgi:hypothetical protein
VDLDVDVRGAALVVARIDPVKDREAVSVGELHAAQPGLTGRALRAFVRVQASGVGVPDIHRGALEGLQVRVFATVISSRNGRPFWPPMMSARTVSTAT